MITYVLLAVVAILIVWFWATYNGFVRLTQHVKEAWADIDVQLKRRYDLIPNLVETVKGYAAHEAGTLEKVTEMRTRAMNATAPADKADAENMLSGALKSLFAVSENYPNLKANEQFRDLQAQLEGTENRIAVARKRYIDSVSTYNKEVRSFPTNLTAKFLGLKTREAFAVAEEVKKAPKVEF